MSEPLESLKAQLKEHLYEVMAHYRLGLIQNLARIATSDNWEDISVSDLADNFLRAVESDVRRLSSTEQMQLITVLALIGTKPATPASTKQALDEIRQL